jgi:hypothetical protein
MAWPDSAGAFPARKAGPGSGPLQLGRGPDLSDFGSAALDVGRCGLRQNAGNQVSNSERAVLARTPTDA